LKVGPNRSQDAGRINTAVLKERSIFGSEYRIDHNLRNFVPIHRNSVHPA